MFIFFFFSSRRRHTRCGRDWSSDVCSSDLGLQRRAVPALGRHQGPALRVAARPHPDAPGLGRHRRQRGRHRGPGRRPAAHGRHRAGPHLRGHRPAGVADLRRFPARPLVHRRAGPRVRLHRRHRRLVRPGHAGQEAPYRAERGSRVSSYTIPNVIAQHPRGERIMDVYSHLLTERIVYLGTGIDPGVANTLIAQLLHLEADSAEHEINLYINCEGGDLPSMLAVYDTMQYIEAPVATTCVGQAIGVGAVLLAAGTPGRRALLPHARVVLHQPAGRGQGPIPDLILQADELVRMRAEIEAILSAHTGRSIETLRADTDRDRVLTAQAALEYGIVDQVLGRRAADAGGPARPAA